MCVRIWPIACSGHRPSGTAIIHTPMGKDGKPFILYKFRTMVADGPQRGPGVTRVGRFLRTLKIDEMPRVINVLKGEMNIVGRCRRPFTVASYKPDDF